MLMENNRQLQQQEGSLVGSMSSKLFNEFSDFIMQQCGIKLTHGKKVLLEARLQKRLRKLNIKSFEKYRDYVFSPHGAQEELVHFIDVITTNKTDFFREPAHFDYLVQKALPELISVGKPYRKIKVWSAGCSTGEEPYTLSIVLNEYEEKNPGFRFEILASDISTKVLEKAVKGIYEMNKLDEIPLSIKKKYFLKHKDKDRQIAKVTSLLKQSIQFKRINFMQPDYGIREPMNIIFCRNVIIYFDRATQEKLIRRFCANLTKGGYIFLGHSETLNGMNLPLTPAAPTIYRKQ